MNIIQIFCAIIISGWLMIAYRVIPIFLEGRIPMHEAAIVGAYGIVSIVLVGRLFWLSRSPRKGTGE